MKLFIMTDLEGVAGVLDLHQWCVRGGPCYPLACELLTLEVNAAIEGFLAAGVTEILVADGHGEGALLPALLHPAARLARNWNDATTGSFSLETAAFDCVAWIGQHPMAGAVRGHLCHTGHMGVVEQRINDLVVGEFGDVALIAGALGIRAIFATGCQAFCAEAAAFVPGIETVAVKQGTQPDPGNHLPPDRYGHHNAAAIHLSPQEARRRIRAGAEAAARRAATESFGLVAPPAPPFTRTRILRADASHAPRIMCQTHPDNFIALHRQPWTERELRINPADSAILNQAMYDPPPTPNP